MELGNQLQLRQPNATPTTGHGSSLQEIPMQQDTIQPVQMDISVVRELETYANDYFDALKNSTPGSPDFYDLLQKIDTIGKGLNAALYIDNINGQSTTVNGLASTFSSLNGLLSLVQNLTRISQSRWVWGKKWKYRKAVDRFANFEADYRQAYKNLMHGKDELARENIAIKLTSNEIVYVYDKINEYLELLHVMEEKFQEKRNLFSGKFQEEILFALNQRRQGLLTQALVVNQSYTSKVILMHNNSELIHQIEHAKNVTLVALRTATTLQKKIESRQNTVKELNAFLSKVSEVAPVVLEEVKPTPPARVQKPLTSAQANYDVIKANAAHVQAKANMLENELYSKSEILHRLKTELEDIKRERELDWKNCLQESYSYYLEEEEKHRKYHEL